MSVVVLPHRSLFQCHCEGISIFPLVIYGMLILWACGVAGCIFQALWFALKLFSVQKMCTLIERNYTDVDDDDAIMCGLLSCFSLFMHHSARLQQPRLR